MSSDKPQPSLSDFDYFNERAKPAELSEIEEAGLPAGLEEQLISFRRAERRRKTSLLLALLALGMASWFVWGYRDQMAYAFSRVRQPLDVGEVTRFRPAELEHNSFVQLEGVTEHRGLKQKMVRGLSFGRQELWYFRLVGSRGVFIEVPPDSERFSYTTAVRVAGRVVDPEREQAYRALLRTYAETYYPKERVEQRILQVGVAPGDQRLRYAALLGLLAFLAAANGFALWRIFSERRMARRHGIIG